MRRIFSILILISLILSVFGLTILFDFTSQNADAIDITKNIQNDDTWTSNVRLMKDISIDAGVTLIINPGVIVTFNGEYSLIVNDTAKLIAKGNKNQKIRFDKESVTNWNGIIVKNHGKAEFDWCVINNSNNGIVLENNYLNNNWYTNVTNCSFNSCTYFFSLLNSKLNATSCQFDGNSFDDSASLTTNLGKLNISDNTISELFIQYFVNIYTVNGSMAGIKDVNVDVSDTPPNQRNIRQGESDVEGQFLLSFATAARINSTIPHAHFGYQTTASVLDRWFGEEHEEPGISNQQIQFNASNATKNSDLYIEFTFMFKYPPKIDDQLTSIKQVKEDQKSDIDFSFHDNDDFVDGYNNLTINITDQNGKGIYNDTGVPNTEDKWIYWENGILYFYRTIESPFSPAPPNDYDAVVHEEIYIKITDLLGQKDSIGPIDVEFINVPDKPVITGLPSGSEIVIVTEDIPKYIPITVSDNDNATNEINVYSSSPYVDYWYNGTTNQKLRLLYKNEFGKNDDTEEVTVYASDGCSERVGYTFVVKFTQTPDTPIINGTIPNYIGNESKPTFELTLGKYATDPDPDDNLNTLNWQITGLDEKVFGKQYVQVDAGTLGATADTPISFSLHPDIDLGGARNPRILEEDITLWLYDQYDLSTNQNVKLIIESTNQPPSLHKLTVNGNKTTVEPTFGVTSDIFQFMIEYKDLDGEKGDAPEFVRVYIDGVPHDMIEQNPSDDYYKDGKIYIYNATLNASEHEHYFECSDSAITTRMPLIEGKPVVEPRIYILQKSSPDETFIVRMAHTSPEGNAQVDNVSKPTAELEPDKEEQNKTKGDISKYFQVKTYRMDTIIWLEIIVEFGPNEYWDDYFPDAKWLRKEDLQLGYYTKDTGEWHILFSEVDTEEHILRTNITPILGLDTLFENLISSTDLPIFTVVGVLDADNDGVFNAKDAFPLDPAASVDTDKDGSPDRWNPGKSAKDSTTGLHLDAFRHDPAASLDDDNDGCPDAWNPGKSQEDSTSEPPLTLDNFPGNPGACMDTDGDNLPDELIKERDNQGLIEDKDDDNDGMSDSWEDQWMRYALEHNLTKIFNPKDPSDAELDFDGDGRKNIDEYRKNSNPYKKDVRAKDDLLASNYIIIIVIIIILILIFIFIYTKVHRERLLEHKVRAEILDLINDRPGVHYRAIMKNLDLQMGTLTHHLNMLERQQYIKSFQDGMYRRFYPKDSAIKTGLILSDVQEKILKLIRSTPGISQTEIANGLGLARKVVNYHIKILSDAGFVEVETVGRQTQCYYLNGLEFKRSVKRKEA